MDIKTIMKAMTLEEKASLLSGKRLWFLNGLKRFGIRDFICSDGPHGLRAYDDFGEADGYPVQKAKATAFPCAACMSSTWNESLIEEVGKTIGKECNHYSVDIILGPGVNGKRSPLGGRNFEYYSEDPVLSAKMGIAFVNGVQSQGVGTSVKHFALNEQETLRRYISSNVDERTFRELYAYPFEQIVKKAKPLTIMAAYNKINGVYACENHDLLTKLLRHEWGFEGIVISDWDGVQHRRASVLAGLDVEMPQSEWVSSFIEDVKNGLYPSDVIDKSVERILKSYEWLLNNENRGKKTDFEENHKIAIKVAEEGIVLLKNENGILPLKKADSVVILGKYALEPRTHGGGSSELLSYKTEIPIEEINRHSSVKYYHDYQLSDESKDAVVKADKVVIFTGTTVEIEHEGADRQSMKLPEEQLSLIREVIRLNDQIIVINSSGSAVEVKDFIQDIRAFIQSWFLGSASGKAIADILYGLVNPSGKLSETFPIQIENTPTFSLFPGKNHKTDYTEGLMTGYRYHDTHQIPVSFPFGFGLSYTTFSYSNFGVSSNSIGLTDTLTITADVKNTGSMSGSESLQLYIKPLDSRNGTPDKMLKSFAKKMIKPDATEKFELILSFDDFSGYYPEFKRFLVHSGKYSVQIGCSSHNIIFETVIDVISDDVTSLPKLLDEPARAWISSPRDYEKIKSFIEKNRKINFYEYEEPMERIIRRIMKENKESEANITSFLNILRNN